MYESHNTTHHKSFLDAGFSCPSITVCLALDKDNVRVSTPIPSQTQGDGTRLLVQPIVIELQLVVV